MVNIAIVEDCQADADLLAAYIQKYSAESGTDVEVRHFNNAVDFLETHKLKFDIVFMDIEMPYMDGMKASHKLRKMDHNVLIIFVTSLAQFAIEGYAVNAFDFVVKPVKYFSFSLKLNRAISHLSRFGTEKLTLKTQKGVRGVALSDIKYVEIFDHNLIYHTTKGIFEVGGHLSSVEDTLISAGFFRCNRCYLVNLRYVTAVEESTANVGGEKLQISRRRRKEFLSALTDYLGGGG